MLALMAGVMHPLLLLFTSVTHAQDSPYYFPSSTTKIVRFNILVDRNLISRAGLEVLTDSPVGFAGLMGTCAMLSVMGTHIL